MVLEISNLSFGYSKEQLLFDNFNLSIQAGSIVSILGASGCGKSTLLELICSNAKPFSGTIKTKKIAMIYQDPYSSFHPSYSILEQIQDCCLTLDSLDEYTEKMQLTLELLSKKPHQLSGGQLQRCSILRAILQKPDLLLADEPTSALDNIIALDVMKLLISFLPSCAILIVTHDQDLAHWCSDKIITLERK